MAETRRSLLDKAALGAAAVAVPAAAVAAEPDELAAICDRFLALDAGPLWGSGDEAVIRRLGQEWGGLLREIAAAPAGTVEGAAAKARLVRRELDEGRSDLAEPLIASLRADLERLAAG